MTFEPDILRATAVERLTTGAGPDESLAVSRDGRRLAFTAKSQQIRNWLFPFDANRGRITDKGQPITATGRTAFVPNLSRDGKHVAFCVRRGGIYELWQKSLLDGREAPIIADEYSRVGSQWSPDGMQLVYSRQKSSEATPTQMMIWSSQTHSEQPLTTLSGAFAHDWSLDGRVATGSPRPHQHQCGDLAVTCGSSAACGNRGEKNHFGSKVRSIPITLLAEQSMDCI